MVRAIAAERMMKWGTALALAAGLSGAAHAAELRPHRAVYDVSLAGTDASADIALARGRLVFDLSGAACEGYVVNSRFVTRVTNREGNEIVTDLSSATFETVDPARFEFRNTLTRNGGTPELVRGSAEASASGLTVERTDPKEATLQLRRAVFPAAHTKLILDTAMAGERVLEIAVFDAGDAADAVYDTTTIIGPGREGLPGASEAERAILEAAGLGEETAWRAVISYFEDGSSGEPTPAYELAFDLLESGIAYNVRFDYSQFALGGELTELALGTAPEC